jgi:hypothetical protein
MNERIRELAEQATTYIEPTANSGEGWIFDKEKFAELLIQQCIQAVKNVGGYNEEYHMNAIKKYFGVEE